MTIPLIILNHDVKRLTPDPSVRIVTAVGVHVVQTALGPCLRDGSSFLRWLSPGESPSAAIADAQKKRGQRIS
jgi:hypothetical protein